jgi:hypothetical protein
MRDQSGVGKYLNDRPKAGTLDLDEADRALRHCGLIGLVEFLNSQPVDRDPPAWMVSVILELPELRGLLTDLRALRPTRRKKALEICRTIVQELQEGQRVGRPLGSGGNTRTKEE